MSRTGAGCPGCCGAPAVTTAAERLRVMIGELRDPSETAAERAARNAPGNPTLCRPEAGPVSGRGLGLDADRNPGEAPASANDPAAPGAAPAPGAAANDLGAHRHLTARTTAVDSEWSSRTQRMEGATQIAGIAPAGCMLPEGCLRFVAPSTGGWGIVRGALAVPESVMLFVAPRGCGRHGSVASVLNGYRHRLFYLDVPEADFVMGGHVDRSEEMVARILDVLPERPRAFFICSTCVDDLLGSDFDGVCARCTERYGIPFSACHMDPITRNSSTPPAFNLQRSIYRTLWLSALAEAAEPGAPEPGMSEPGAREPGAVNLIGGFVPVDGASELYRVFARAGIDKVRQLPGCRTFDEFLEMRRASFNLMLKGHASLACADMRDRLGIPFVRVRQGFGVEEVRALYRDLGRGLGVEFDVSEEAEACAAHLDEARGWLSGLSVAVGENLNGSSFEIALLLARLGARIPFVISDAIAPAEWPAILELRELQPDVAVYPASHPGLSLVSEVPERADVAIGFDAAKLAPGSRLFEFGCDVEPFGFEAPLSVVDGVRGALEHPVSAKELLYSKGLVV